VSIHTVKRIRGHAGLYRSSPSDCERHAQAGRLPIFHGMQCVAYVDAVSDMPEAKWTVRYGKPIGHVDAWTYSA
jgi:hypothetical protein